MKMVEDRRIFLTQWDTMTLQDLQRIIGELILELEGVETEILVEDNCCYVSFSRPETDAERIVREREEERRTKMIQEFRRETERQQLLTRFMLGEITAVEYDRRRAKIWELLND